MAKIPKIIETDEGVLCWCSHEKIYRPIEMFHQNQKGTYSYFCDDCLIEINKKKKNSHFDAKKYSDEILDLLGYDVDGYIPIHEQFKRKHKL